MHRCKYCAALLLSSPPLASTKMARCSAAVGRGEVAMLEPPGLIPMFH
jgi:hypothetical protein